MRTNATAQIFEGFDESEVIHQSGEFRLAKSLPHLVVLAEEVPHAADLRYSSCYTISALEYLTISNQQCYHTQTAQVQERKDHLGDVVTEHPCELIGRLQHPGDGLGPPLQERFLGMFTCIVQISVTVSNELESSIVGLDGLLEFVQVEERSSFASEDLFDTLTSLLP